MNSSAHQFVHAPTVKFRGARNYVHSTDLYAELMTAAAADLVSIEGQVTLAIRKPIITQPEFRFGEAASDTSAPPATFQLATPAGIVSGTIVGSERPVLEHAPYDEKRIWSKARIDGDRAEIIGDTGMAPIEVLTALAVFQHKALFPPPADKRWYLTKLSLARPLRREDAPKITIVLSRAVGRAMTHSTLGGATGKLGSMNFVLGASSMSR